MKNLQELRCVGVTERLALEALQKIVARAPLHTLTFAITTTPPPQATIPVELNLSALSPQLTSLFAHAGNVKLLGDDSYGQLRQLSCKVAANSPLPNLASLRCLERFAVKIIPSAPATTDALLVLTHLTKLKVLMHGSSIK